jgi:hypothetical protein
MPVERRVEVRHQVDRDLLARALGRRVTFGLI